ncbi:MAG: DUF362 domain-containing protein [Syntrophales bacterium]|nr:DUF362 domain-containing protein [Syntrophales bacterium]
MNKLLYYDLERFPGQDAVSVLRSLLASVKIPFNGKGEVGIKIHWGERGNRSFLPPVFAREIVRWTREHGFQPFIFDTTVLYSGGRREAAETLKTAAKNGYHEDYLGCPVVVADGMDGRNVVDIPAGFKHFKTAQVASVFEKADGFIIFSHFKGHMASSFGGALKNLSMGFASRAQKQRMHADAHPELTLDKCSNCGQCIEVCPVGAAQEGEDGYPAFDLKKCIGCAQCIAMCTEGALKVFWNTDDRVFQEKLVETAAAVWKQIENRSVLINALLKITEECDCWPGRNEIIAPDYGFIGGYHPVALDEASVRIIGAAPFEKAHPGIHWQRQFEYAREIGFRQ